MSEKPRVNLPNIETMRKAYGMTRAQLGESLGFAERSVGRWENGTSDPTFSTVQRIARFFNTTVAYLAGDVDKP